MYNNIWYFHNCCSFTYIDCKKYVCNFFHSLCRHLHRNGKTVTRLLISVVSGRQVGVEGGRRVFYILYTLVLFQIFMWPYYERETWIKYQRKKRRCAILRKISSVQLLSPIWLFVTPWTAALPCPSPTPGVYSNSCPLRRWCHPNISSSVVSFSLSLQSFPASGSFKWISSSYQMAKVLEFQLQHQDWWCFPVLWPPLNIPNLLAYRLQHFHSIIF